MNDQPIVDSDEPTAPARSWNRSAVLAAMFCIPFFCPPMTLIGAGAGAFALRSLKKNPDTKGAWLAWTAISFGVVCTILASWMFWISGLRTIVLGPSLALAPLFANDTQGMKREWDGPATALSQEQLAQFTTFVSDRYGKYISAHISEQRATPLEQSWKRSMVVIPITIIFSSGPIEADLGLERFNQKTGKSSMIWRSLRILDAANADVLFPEGEPAPPALETRKLGEITAPESSGGVNTTTAPAKAQQTP